MTDTLESLTSDSGIKAPASLDYLMIVHLIDIRERLARIETQAADIGRLQEMIGQIALSVMKLETTVEKENRDIEKRVARLEALITKMRGQVIWLITIVSVFTATIGIAASSLIGDWMHSIFKFVSK